MSSTLPPSTQVMSILGFGWTSKVQTWQIEVSSVLTTITIEVGKKVRGKRGLSLERAAKVSFNHNGTFFVSNLCPEQKTIVMQKRTYSSIIFLTGDEEL